MTNDLRQLTHVLIFIVHRDVRITLKQRPAEASDFSRLTDFLKKRKIVYRLLVGDLERRHVDAVSSPDPV